MIHDLPALATEPHTLPDGTELTAQQHNAAVLRSTTDMTLDMIAEQTGYHSASAVSRFLQTDRGKVAVENAVRTHLLDGATVALQTMIALAKGAKSENVRQMAAADLMDRAGLRLEAKPDAGTGNRDVQISINLTTGDDTARVIEHD
jgi:hypothetical protein